jgi:hypothetical protein
MRRRLGFRRLCCALIVITAWASEAWAQGAVGSGPLTSTLTETEPASGVLSFGSIKLAPGLTISQIGWDSNVFNETSDPKQDFIAGVKPDLSIFTRLRFLQLSAYTGGDLNYFQLFESERSSGYAGRARIDLLLSRLFPFVGYGETKTRERPGSEIDTRADSKVTELSTGVGFRWSETGSIYLSSVQMNTRFEAAFEDGVDLSQALNRSTDDYSAGLRTALTPLTSLTLRAGYAMDLFKVEKIRNADRRYLTGTLAFAPQAVITGTVTVSYQDFRPADPLVRTFRGLTGSAAVSYPLLEVGRINFNYGRSLEYSFDIAEAYYLSNSFTLTYTHRLRDALDVQLAAGRTLADYGQRESTPERRDTSDKLNGSLGYNLRNRTRVALNYEYSRRRSVRALQNYEGRRVYLSWTYAF